jgi:transposase
MSNFIVADRKTDYLLPPSLDVWLNEHHLARFIVEVIDQLDLSNLTRQYAGRGSKAHHPATLLAILVYGYATGVFSSRKLEQATYDSVAFRYIAADTHPDHDTLATFRRRFLDELSDLFVPALELAKEMKLLKFRTPDIGEIFYGTLGGLVGEREVGSGVANIEAVEGFTESGQGVVVPRTGQRMDAHQQSLLFGLRHDVGAAE